MLPAMFAVRKDFSQYRFVIGKAPGLDASLYKDVTGTSDVELFEGGTQALLRMADAALVTSGTATLETALLGVPQLVCYRGNALSVMLARKLIKVKYISLVNLILDREAVTELIQGDLNRDNITTRLASLLSSDGRQQAQQIKDELWNRLGGAGASANAARIVVDALKKLSKA
jgi:lipid-A-disaccharide synthase